ncbi:MAG: adenylate kinase [Geitlerinemataceae cyanobacterium]
MRLVILGGPGAGKGTQGRRLCEALEIPSIATGDIFRAAIADRTELGDKAAPYVERGDLVPDELTIEFMRDRLTKPDAKQGWLLDGYPRTAFQAEELSFLLSDLGQRLDWAIWFDVPVPVMMKRSLSRSRDDDAPEIIRRRIDLFHNRTIPIVEFYEMRGRLLRIDASRDADTIHQDVLAQIG